MAERRACHFNPLQRIKMKENFSAQAHGIKVKRPLCLTPGLLTDSVSAFPSPSDHTSETYPQRPLLRVFSFFGSRPKRLSMTFPSVQDVDVIFHFLKVIVERKDNS